MVVNQDGLIMTEEITSANESDTRHLKMPLEKVRVAKGTPVMADKGYDSARIGTRFPQ